MKQESGLTSASTIEAIEDITAAAGWEFERIDEDEVAVIVTNSTTQYRLHFLWHKEFEMLYIACFADIEGLDSNDLELQRLIFMSNQRLWLGHFDVFEDKSLVLRHTLPLRGVGSLNVEQIEDLIDVTLGQFNLFYPAFKHMLIEGASARESFDSALIDTAGEA